MSNFYLITDLELTCWDVEDFPREHMEIIEIGAVLCDEYGKILKEYQSFVKPTKHPILSDFCKKLTTIRQEDVDNAETLFYVMEDFNKWLKSNIDTKKDNCKFGSWGWFDSKHIEKECKEKGIEQIIVNNPFNIKEDFSKWRWNNKRKRVGLRKALNLMSMNFEGTQHRAISDAINTAKLYERILLAKMKKEESEL